MIELMIRLMVLAALAQFGMSVAEVSGCKTGQCLARLKEASREVLRVEWRPISVFPEEGSRFR
jgi:hypothetical protein